MDAPGGTIVAALGEERAVDSLIDQIVADSKAKGGTQIKTSLIAEISWYVQKPGRCPRSGEVKLDIRIYLDLTGIKNNKFFSQRFFLWAAHADYVDKRFKNCRLCPYDTKPRGTLIATPWKPLVPVRKPGLGGK
jgi:hypothetical protein